MKIHRSLFMLAKTSSISASSMAGAPGLRYWLSWITPFCYFSARLMEQRAEVLSTCVITLFLNEHTDSRFSTQALVSIPLNWLICQKIYPLSRVHWFVEWAAANLLDDRDRDVIHRLCDSFIIYYHFDLNCSSFNIFTDDPLSHTSHTLTRSHITPHSIHRRLFLSCESILFPRVSLVFSIW